MQSLGSQRARHDLATKQQQGLVYLISKVNTFFFQGFGSTDLHINNIIDRFVVVYNASDSACVSEMISIMLRLHPRKILVS